MLDRRFARSLVATAAAVAACLGPPAAATVVHAGTWPLTVRLAAADDQGGRSTPYRDGQKALDDKDWKAAARAFRGVAGAKGSEADAALYWLAYALHQDGDEAGALAALRDLRASYPRSGWIDDSRALELELRGRDTRGIAGLPRARDHPPAEPHRPMTPDGRGAASGVKGAPRHGT